MSYRFDPGTNKVI